MRLSYLSRPNRVGIIVHTGSRVLPWGVLVDKWELRTMYFYKPLPPSQVMLMEVASGLHFDKLWCVGSVRIERMSSNSKEQSGLKK